MVCIFLALGSHGRFRTWRFVGIEVNLRMVIVDVGVRDVGSISRFDD